MGYDADPIEFIDNTLSGAKDVVSSVWVPIRDTAESVATLAADYYTLGLASMANGWQSKGSQEQLGSPVGQLTQLGASIAGGVNGAGLEMTPVQAMGLGAARGAVSNPDNPVLGATRGAAMSGVGQMANMPTDTSNYTASDYVNAANNQDWSQYANPALHTADTAYNTYNNINNTANAINRIANGPPQRPRMQRPTMGRRYSAALPAAMDSPQQQFTANNSALVGGRPLNTTGSAGLIRSVPNMRRQVPTMKFAQGGLVQFSKTRRSK